MELKALAKILIILDCVQKILWDCDKRILLDCQNLTERKKYFTGLSQKILQDCQKNFTGLSRNFTGLSQKILLDYRKTLLDCEKLYRTARKCNRTVSLLGHRRSVFKTILRAFSCNVIQNVMF